VFDNSLLPTFVVIENDSYGWHSLVRSLFALRVMKEEKNKYRQRRPFQKLTHRRKRSFTFDKITRPD